MQTLKLVSIVLLLTVFGCKKELTTPIQPTTHPHTRGGYRTPGEETPISLTQFNTLPIGNGYIDYYNLSLVELKKYMEVTGASTIGIYDASIYGQLGYVIIPIDENYKTIITDCLLDCVTYVSSYTASNLINSCKVPGRVSGIILPKSTTDRLLNSGLNIRIYNTPKGAVVGNVLSFVNLPSPTMCDNEIPTNLYSLNYTCQCLNNCDYY
jgi:hypothetical protein